MGKEDHNQIYEILLSMKEDMGEMKSDIKTTMKLSESTANTVKNHDDIIKNWQGRLAVIGAIAGILATTVVSWIRKEFNF